MFSEELDRLLTLAEIAIGMAGFSAIVVLFKRRDSGTWLAADADRFNGMILHSMIGVALCILPALIGAFSQDVGFVWRVASAILGLQVLTHSGLVIFALSTTGPGAALVVGAGGLVVVALQVVNVLDLGSSTGFGPYLVGVLWHLLHAGFLFAALIWVRAASIEH